MDQIDGATIFWLIACGMLAGGLIKLILGNKGLGIGMNLLLGIGSTVIVGCCGMALQIGAGTLLGILGSLAVLFISNVFFIEPELQEH